MILLDASPPFLHSLFVPPSVPLIYAHDPFLAIHGALQARWLDGPMLALSVVCEGWTIAVIGLVLFGVAERNIRRLLACFLPLGFGLLASGALVYLLKEISYLPRPLQVFGPDLVHVLGEPLYIAGLPSGHATAAALLAVYATCVYGRRLWPLWLLPLLGGLSRIYVGAHWVLDVLAGWALGGGLGLAAYFGAVKLMPGGCLARWRRMSRD